MESFYKEGQEHGEEGLARVTLNVTDRKINFLCFTTLILWAAFLYVKVLQALTTTQRVLSHLVPFILLSFITLFQDRLLRNRARELFLIGDLQEDIF
jgi:hypothetical protein